MKTVVPIVVVFLLYLFIGLKIAPDYGMGYDDEAQRLIGQYNYDAVTGNASQLLAFNDRYYGPAFELILKGIEHVSGDTSTQQIYLMRHRVTFFAFWLGTLAFFLMATHIFNGVSYGILGASFLALSPRFFAESFYNTKDIPFMSASILAFGSLLLLTQKRSLMFTFAYAIVASFATAIRPFGLLFPIFLAISELPNLARPKERTGSLARLAVFTFVYSISTIFLWPILRFSPMQQFLLMMKESAKHFDQPIFYLGSFVSSAAKPWHYLPVIMLVTIPPIISILFVIGIFFSVIRLVKQKNPGHHLHYTPIFIAAWLFIPLAVVYITNPRIYDGWRHVYFLYPPIILTALYGYRELERKLRKAPIIFLLILYGTVIGTQINLLVFNARNHPYQYVYFNIFAGGIQRGSNLFDFDYWGLSETEALRYILSHDDRPVIRVYFADTPGLMFMLSDREQSRIVPAAIDSQPDYIITQFRWKKERNIDGFEPIYSITSNNAVLSAIYRRSSQTLHE